MERRLPHWLILSRIIYGILTCTAPLLLLLSSLKILDTPVIDIFINLVLVVYDGCSELFLAFTIVFVVLLMLQQHRIYIFESCFHLIKGIDILNIRFVLLVFLLYLEVTYDIFTIANKI